MVEQFFLALAAAIAAMMMAAVPYFWLTRRARPAPHGARLEREIEPIAFLFRNGVLIDATAPARSLLDRLPGADDWQRLTAWLAMRLPDLGPLLPDLAAAARIEMTETAVARPLHLLAEGLGQGFLRLTLTDPSAENAGVLVNSLSLAAMENELEILRSTMDHAPMLAWREDAAGQLTWANSAYLALAEAKADQANCWPLPRLIDLTARPPAGGGAASGARRAQIEHDGQSRWYEWHAHQIGGQTVAVALPADAAVRAERSLREFVQTLTKTFADLPIGLAIFDRDRNLQLFNPALIDLTGLAAGFLTGRPTLYAFLDRLREARMVPEPKDYRSWRNQMNSLEAAASSGHHVEMWSLPGGQTYRVTGRPHPDGAVAFLFEDITSEISLTRKFRADLSLGAEVLDALDDAVAVFAASGDLLLSNRRYGELWGTSGRSTLGEQIGRWSRACGDSPGLEQLRLALDRMPLAHPAQGAMAGPNGGLLSWGLRSLSGGRVLLSFAAPLPAPPSQLVAPEPGQDAAAADRGVAVAG
ncbi:MULTISPECIES: PAS-domain containing protein [unclassified Paracoccus (in: a-proteobacteria)]|uniref:PAS-domain containing protein n=1 Tax=unclassified Paracoccus (in: a-proteobacteria) TaxID=2688777 RepID=UPI0012B31C91|nr:MULTISPECIES: PAS-domain containing protein [unclassified Paracoccus (in: a-proteobacteria)]UXU75777.1 PAS-domain containing protein [Paracoccus sp. SMMA_5]UXU81686.1 PAS-domain containing protein [Paracoccus sp. SMMA_5_TC]